MALTATTVRRRSLVEYAPALAIAVIAAIAIAAVALQNEGGRNGSSGVTTPAPLPAYYDSRVPVYVMYIVDSQEKADGIAKSEQEMLMAYMDSYQLSAGFKPHFGGISGDDGGGRHSGSTPC